MEPYLLHGIKWRNYDLLIKLLKSSFLLPRKDLEKGLVTDKNNIFNGDTYISFCRKTPYDPSIEEDYSYSFEEFILDNPCLVLKEDNIDIIKPRLLTRLDKSMMSPEEWRALLFRNDGERVSYYYDEVMTRDKISLRDNLVAVGLPTSYLKYSKDGEEVLGRVQNTLTFSGLSVPIIDSSVYSFCDNSDNIEKNKIKSLK